MQRRLPKTGNQKKRRNISPLSPIGLALISYLFFLVMTIVPPHAYEAIMREDDLIFLNPSANLFVAMCVLGFIAGVLLFTWLRNAAGPMPQRPRPPISRMAIMLPLLASTVLSALSLALLLHKEPDLLFSWFKNGTEAKIMMYTGAGKNTLAGAGPLAFGIYCWVLWRLFDREKATRVADWGLRAAFCLSVLLAVFTCVIEVTRSELLPGFFSILLAFIIYKHKDAHTALIKYVVSLGKAIMATMGIFVLFSWFFRGNNDGMLLIRSIVGYTGASYNRLAALLDGSLVYPYGGSGCYAFNFLGSMPPFNHFIDFRSLFGMPSSHEVWLSEFSAVGMAGLDERFIWSSAFGYIYADLGWWLTVLYFFFLGMLSSSLWTSINRGRAAGIVLYPLFAFSILFWFGGNLIASNTVYVVAVAGLLLSAYESFLSESSGAGQPKSGVLYPRRLSCGLSSTRGAGQALRP